MRGSKDTQRAASTAGHGAGGHGAVVAVGTSDPPLPIVLQRVFEGLPMGVLVFDAQFGVIFQNREAQVVLPDGDNLAVMLAKGTIDGAEKDWAVELRTVLGSGRPQRFDHVDYRTGGNQHRLLNLTCAPVPDGSSDRPSVGYLLVEDVTADKSLEKRLAASERYAAVGKLAARVAHELNNPLDGILRFINLAERTLQPDGQDKPRNYLGQARRGLMRMARIISDLLEYSRSSAVALEEGNINDIVEDAVKAMEDKTLQSKVTVVCDFAPEMPRVPGASLFQVFCNLIKNAADAMPDGGRLVITTKRHADEAFILFEDSGVGFPAGDVDRVFEPFYTTKDSGEGTGLGLAICRDFIEDKYHGKITAENRVDGGARLILRIPTEISPPASGDETIRSS